MAKALDIGEMARLLWLDLETCRGCGLDKASAMPERAVWMFLGRGGEPPVDTSPESEGAFACLRCAFRCSVTHQDREQLANLFSQTEATLLQILAALLKVSRRLEGSSSTEEILGADAAHLEARSSDVCRLCMGVLQDTPGDRESSYLEEVLHSMNKDIKHEFKDYSFHSMLPHASMLRESVLEIALPSVCPYAPPSAASIGGSYQSIPFHRY